MPKLCAAQISKSVSGRNKVFLHVKSQKIIDKNKNAFYEKNITQHMWEQSLIMLLVYCVLLSNIINAYF